MENDEIVFKLRIIDGRKCVFESEIDIFICVLK